MGKIMGTKEWAKHSVNFQIGCRNNCRYCYARARAQAFRYSPPEGWRRPRTRMDEILKARGLLDGRIMFPTTHDITRQNLSLACGVLEKLLSAGNQVLLVSKPWLECIEPILKLAAPYREQITFRFSITGHAERFREYWEPGASSYKERHDCLHLAWSQDFSTSISAEPCLDFGNVDGLIARCLPYITDTLWIGKLNKARQRIPIETEQDRAAVNWIIRHQSDDIVRRVYDLYKDCSKIRWKESIKDVIGLPRATEAGQDV